MSRDKSVFFFLQRFDTRMCLIRTDLFLLLYLLKLLKIFELDFHVVICARGANLGKYFSLKILKILDAYAVHTYAIITNQDYIPLI